MKLRITVTSLFFVSYLGAVTNREAVRMIETDPLRFEPASEGSSTRFIARGARHKFSFAGNEAILQAGTKAIRMRFEGAASGVRMDAIDLLPSTTALYLGNDPSKWRPAIPNYGKLRVQGLYQGVDLVYYGNAG